MTALPKQHTRTHRQISTPLLAALLSTVPSLAAAQVAAPIGAGTILQQVRPSTLRAPTAPGAPLTIEPGTGGSLPVSAPIAVTTIRITGATLIDPATLHLLVADAEGQSLTLPQLGQVADRITDYYHSHNYPLAKALVPPQAIHEGVVVIDVVEARYGAVDLNNSSHVNNSLVRSTLSPLRSGAPIAESALDRSLLFLSDIPGAIVSATLKPGASVGTSDLLVDVGPGPAVSGDVVLDNYGNRYTGRARLSGAVNFFNLAHHGDVLTLSGLTSGQGLNYARLGYETTFDGRGDRIGASYSMLQYEIGHPLQALDAHGDARVASAWLSHPFIRTRTFNLYGQIQYDHLQLDDHIDAGGIRNDRHLDDWTLSLFGDERDGWFSGGVTAWSVAWTHGNVSFDDSAAAFVDAATARTAGDFSIWSAQISRLQRLNSNTSLYLALSGQWADGNLDSAMKMIATGPYNVRAYDVGELSGDNVYQGTAELRRDLGDWHGRWEAIAFVDSAHVTVNDAPWAAGPNEATLTGAGIGLNWYGAHGVTVRTYAAARIGDAPAILNDDASGRFGIAIGKGF